MSRIDFLAWILMIVFIFFVWSIGKEGLAFTFMSIYAISGGILCKLQRDMVKECLALTEDILLRLEK